jgi:penicillin-binding protein A
MGRRIRWLGLVLILCFALVILQLVNVQFRQASALNSSTKNPRNSATRLDNQRGLILAATGSKILAQSKRIPDASAGGYQYYRTYPTGTLFSGIVGYSSSYYGTSGAEDVYNTQLVPHAQPATTLGQLLSPPAPTTDDVTLTVTPTLQRVAQQSLAAVPDANKDGAVVALDPKTGAVLAMYSSPTFNSNTLAQPDVTKEEVAGRIYRTVKDHEGFTAWPPLATFDRFEPGSTFKVVTSAAVYNLDPSLITFDYPTQGCTTPGSIPTTDKQICNDGHTEATATPCGGTMVQMLPQSCDPGYATLGLKLGATTLYKQAELFGLNSIPPIDLTSTVVSRSKFPTPTSLSPGHKPGPPGVAYSAFGQQTVSETALQNAMVAEGIADTGTVMTPHVMAQIDNSQGALVQTYKPTVYKTATTTAASAQSVKSLMRGVVTTPLGTAHIVGFPTQDDVAVKTGTAQVGTSTQDTDDWMIGLAPASDPTVAIAVVVPYQATSNSGAEIAGPIMKAMIEATLAEQAKQAAAATTTTTMAPHITTTTPHTTTHTTIPHDVPTTTAPSAPVPTTTVPPTTTTTTPTATTAPPATTTTTVTPPPTTTTMPISTTDGTVTTGPAG